MIFVLLSLSVVDSYITKVIIGIIIIIIIIITFVNLSNFLLCKFKMGTKPKWYFLD